MEWKLELVIVPVTDVDRAKHFYSEQVGFAADFDRAGDQMRLVQLTPPGSGCSIAIGPGLSKLKPGSLEGVQLVVSDLHAARAQLVERGVDVSGIQVFDETGIRPEREGDVLDNVGFVFFSDPDGNAWAVQQIRRA